MSSINLVSILILSFYVVNCEISNVLCKLRKVSHALEEYIILSIVGGFILKKIKMIIVIVFKF